MKNYTNAEGEKSRAKPKIIVFSALLLGLFSANAQQATIAAGGNASGSGGNASYTIGQVAYTSQTGSAGTVTQGVQQPFEISTLSGQEFTNIILEALVYPNPTTAKITLKISDLAAENLNYQMYDIQGRMMSDGKISSPETVFDVENYPTATYLLKINSNTKELKTFKIIKN